MFYIKNKDCNVHQMLIFMGHFLKIKKIHNPPPLFFFSWPMAGCRAGCGIFEGVCHIEFRASNDPAQKLIGRYTFNQGYCIPRPKYIVVRLWALKPIVFYFIFVLFKNLISILSKKNTSIYIYIG